jgi:hypothetical protein
MGFEQNACSPWRKASSGLDRVGLGKSLRLDVGKSISMCAPLDEILPEDEAAKRGKAGQMKPFPRRGVRDTGADSELFSVHRLIQAAFFQDRFKRDALQLFVVALGQERFSVRRFHTSRSLPPITNSIAEIEHFVPMKMALAADLLAFAYFEVRGI